jgi:hypothetical protein
LQAIIGGGGGGGYQVHINLTEEEKIAMGKEG